MTENEAREVESILRQLSEDENIDSYCTESLKSFADDGANAIEFLLEEIQAYRAIGTVKGYERAIKSSIENYNLYKEYKAKVQEFEAIGTIEEFKALKETDIPIIHGKAELELHDKEIRAKAIDEFEKEIVAEYDNDACPVVADYLDYTISIRDLFKIAEQLRCRP